MGSGYHDSISAADGRLPGAGPRDGAVMAAALRHALRGSLSIDEAAVDLARLARGEGVSLDQAIARVRSGLSSRPASVGHYALEALKRARAIVSHPAQRRLPA